MAEIKKVLSSELKARSGEFRCGDKIFLSGTVYTARDAAHKRFNTLLNEGKELPIPIKGSVIYYAGPTPAPEGKPIGSCGPTTSGRMDRFAPRLLDLGLGGMIGKGERNIDVRDAIVRNKALYLCSIGGAGALAYKCIKSCEVVAFDDLGCESVKKLNVENFPLVVADDVYGGDIFHIGRQKFCSL